MILCGLIWLILCNKYHGTRWAIKSLIVDSLKFLGNPNISSVVSIWPLRKRFHSIKVNQNTSFSPLLWCHQTLKKHVCLRGSCWASRNSGCPCLAAEYKYVGKALNNDLSAAKCMANDEHISGAGNKPKVIREVPNDADGCW